MDDQAWLDCSYPRNKGAIMYWLLSVIAAIIILPTITVYFTLVAFGKIIDSTEHESYIDYYSEPD
jgi:hypothetical protein